MTTSASPYVWSCVVSEMQKLASGRGPAVIVLSHELTAADRFNVRMMCTYLKLTSETTGPPSARIMRVGRKGAPVAPVAHEIEGNDVGGADFTVGDKVATPNNFRSESFAPCNVTGGLCGRVVRVDHPYGHVLVQFEGDTQPKWVFKTDVHKLMRANEGIVTMNLAGRLSSVASGGSAFETEIERSRSPRARCGYGHFGEGLGAPVRILPSTTARPEEEAQTASEARRSGRARVTRGPRLCLQGCSVHEQGSLCGHPCCQPKNHDRHHRCANHQAPRRAPDTPASEVAQTTAAA